MRSSRVRRTRRSWIVVSRVRGPVRGRQTASLLPHCCLVPRGLLPTEIREMTATAKANNSLAHSPSHQAFLSAPPPPLFPFPAPRHRFLARCHRPSAAPSSWRWYASPCARGRSSVLLYRCQKCRGKRRRAHRPRDARRACCPWERWSWETDCEIAVQRAWMSWGFVQRAGGAKRVWRALGEGCGQT